uniref:UDP-N-acetylglucosamine--peptide N-acetylglucosaminyltransferase SPINDLY n=2 Tax=Pinguiococcus pyrenoidosus TaxID=172671 RepID=A0A7R9U522_9STRA|mmetsp:Transcript_14600/g.55158  ORF Transcript_14600/g.55158 Transcript_14600/m.55158 type:complete len:383 (+) Transcript_14600:174-1322(+)
MAAVRRTRMSTIRSTMYSHQRSLSTSLSDRKSAQVCASASVHSSSNSIRTRSAAAYLSEQSHCAQRRKMGMSSTRTKKPMNRSWGTKIGEMNSTAARRNSSRPVSCASPFLAPARAPFNMLAISQMCGCGGNAEAREAEQPAGLAPGAAATDNSRATTNYNLGTALQDSGKLDEAILCYLDALAQDPAYVDAYYNLGSAYGQKEMFAEAIAAYEKAIELKPDYALAYYNLGYIHQDEGRVEEAIDCFRKASDHDPNDADTWINLGNALRSAGPNRLADAVDAYKKAVEVDPKSVMAFYNLGSGYQDQGRLDDAIKTFQSALIIDPDYVDALFNLGIAYQDRGDLDLALSCYERAEQLEPEFQEAAQAAAAIREIQKNKAAQA